MSSPGPDQPSQRSRVNDMDDPMQESGQEEVEEGDVVMPSVSDDSSEEGEEDEEEAREIRDGFIVDEEEEEEEEEEEAPRRRRKRRKRHHRKEETLEDDDLELLEENTGGTFKRKSRLTRLRHHHDSESPPTASSSKRRAVVESSEDDLDNEEDLREASDIRKIWDDDRRGDDDDEDMDDFIDYSDEEEAGAMNEEAREARREEKRQEQLRRRKARVRPELAGIDANAWDEIHDVFGDGHEYDWALGDEEGEFEEEHYKQETKYQEVFEPSEIRKRMLTEDDDLIRARDIPERMQLATSSLSLSSALLDQTQLTEDDLGGAAMWVTQRISAAKMQDYFSPDGHRQDFKGALVMAVTFVLRQIFVEQYEVPYIWAHKRDYITRFDIHDIRSRDELLNLEELWRISTLGQKYKSLMERRKALSTSYQRLQVRDEYYEDEIEPQVDSVEVVADATEWLSMKYKDKKQDTTIDFRFHDDDEPETEKKRKMPTRISAYEVAKKSVVSKLAEKFGIQPHQVVLNFLASHHVHFIDDVDLNPIVFAEQFADSDPAKAQSPEELLRRARLILSTELGKDPLLRSQIRKMFREEARITVEPTDRGINKIDENHPYFSFKYLFQKPIEEMLKSFQFLHILAAESEHLVTVSVSIPPDAKAAFERRLLDAFSSDNFTDSAKAWNAERSRIVQEVIEQHLIPAGVKWTREFIRDEVEDSLASKCREQLRVRIDAAPYLTRELRYGEISSSVLAISWGKGDPHKDAIALVYVDEAGRLREHTKIDNLHDSDNNDEFLDLVKRRKPDVVVVGGFSIATVKLMHRVKEVLSGNTGTTTENGWGSSNGQGFDIPAIYVHDDVARMYQHSKRATDEFSALSPTAKYCVGLARYVQSPLNEFAALGGDITAISFDEENQHLVPKEKLLASFEQVLVDVTNKVGVDINRAVTDPYYQHLLPFVCGMGPRKSQVLIKKIVSQGGTLVNRDQFIKAGLLTTKIFLNAAGFLRVVQDREAKQVKYRAEDENAPDPLDDTRIHPEDYELARKMATDALELDEEDIHDEHPSHVVGLIMNDPDKERKLIELNLDEFAISLYEANHDQKRHTLNVIREELLRPFSEKRETFRMATDTEILTMLSGETPKTLSVGLVVSAMVSRISKDVVTVRLDSGIEAYLPAANLPGTGGKRTYDIVTKGQTITAIVSDMRVALGHDELHIELTARSKDLDEGDSVFRRVEPDVFWDENRYIKDQEMLARKKRAETDRTRRVIKHPNFHNFNTAQAEAYLEKQQRGDVVIRPSSKGVNHLAVTWKVDDRLYQHIDVTELNADPTGQIVGGQLVVDAQHTYSDLDELIVNHVQAMTRRVEELMAHEKFKHGSEDDLHLFLKNYLAANPAKSMYGFTLNRKRPGHFNLCFLANKNATVQTWPVRVAPEAYYLFDAAAVGVPELCDAFKVRHLHESQNLAVAAAGGKTPYGAGMRTPARLPGGATPGHMSVRQVPARTPNPYSGGQTPFVPNPPNVVPPQQHSYGYQTPSHRPPMFAGQPPSMPPNMSHPPPPRPPGVWGQQSTWS